MKCKLLVALALLCFTSSPVLAQHSVITLLTEKKIAELPAGPLFWRIENFPTTAQAQAAAGPTGLVAEADGKVWLFTLGPQGQASAGGSKVAEIGPIPRVTAKHYLLRINEANGPADSVTPVHTHPGSEAFYVLAGEISQKTAHGIAHVAAGQSMAGHGPDTPMQVSGSGATDHRELVMFVLDADRPFSSPAKFD